MRPSSSALVLPLMLLAAACGDSGSHASAAGSPTTTSSSGTEGQPTSAGDTEGSSAREICERYLACISAVAPSQLPAAQMGFGESGSCWQGSASEAQLCLDACEAGLEMFLEVFPNERKCALCHDHAECDTPGGLCYRGQCIVTTCNDGIVGTREVCDSQPGCDADCRGPLECNPFSNFGCTELEACVVRNVPINGPFEQATMTECLASPWAAEGSPCENNCGLGLGCASAALLPGCKADGGAFGCCTPLCMLDSPAQCADDEKCIPYQNPLNHPLLPELSYLGFCVPE